MLKSYIEFLNGVKSSENSSLIDVFKAVLLELKVIFTLIWIPIFFIGGWLIPSKFWKKYMNPKYKIYSEKFENYNKKKKDLNHYDATQKAAEELEKSKKEIRKSYTISRYILLVCRIIYLLFLVPMECYLLDCFNISSSGFVNALVGISIFFFLVETIKEQYDLNENNKYIIEHGK